VREIAVIRGYGTTGSEEDIPLKKPLFGFRARPVLKIPEYHRLSRSIVFPSFYIPFAKRATITPPLHFYLKFRHQLSHLAKPRFLV
jgi:hypothetical protein